MHVHSNARERGANLVEAALVVPLLIILLAAVVDLGRAYFTYITIIDAAREGARYGASRPNDADRNAQICNRVLAESAGQRFVLIGPLNLNCADNVSVVTSGVPGTPVSVTVDVVFPVFLGAAIGQPDFPMSYTAAFRIRCEVGTGC